MKMIPLVVAVILAVAAAGFAWQRNQALDETRAALADANARLQKTQSELKSVTAEVAPLRKEVAELKTASEQQRVELAAAKGFLDAERATTARVREELAMAKEQMAFILKTRASQSAPSGAGYPELRLVRPVPIRVEAAPAPTPRAAPMQAAPMRAQ